MKEQKFRKLTIWNKAMSFIEDIYKITNKFPTNEIYGLTSQLRRAATSIALNIAEGSGAGSDNEFNRFLSISLRSSYEVMCGLEIAKRLNYLNERDISCLIEKSDEISAMISGLKKKLKADS
ncbi:MAG: four helix bundle protein [Candidatus Omnitrophica bacterium]|nr:four helix bundle protein [Candidatus Omnitrophota bacterium]MBU4487843.1 four helix bundle protein [Candidatus Omnitrophota bacterium]MCG2704626.1 four helix bundle protein [Candidatus Omnitrophota bacterium]